MIWPVALLIAFAMCTWLRTGNRLSIDEAWMMVVVRRVRRRELLYRDVFFGAGPTPVWLLAATTKLIGFEVIVLRLLVALAAAISATAAALAVHQSGATTQWVVVVYVSGVMISAAHGTPEPLYTALTRAGLAVLVACVLADPAAGGIAVVVAGVAAGIAVTSKYNAGGAGTLLVLGAAVAGPWTLGDALLTLAVGSLVGIVSLLPLCRGGGLTAMYRRLVVNKSAYLEHGRIGYLDGARRSIRRAPEHPILIRLTSAAVYLAAPASMGAAIAAIVDISGEQPSPAAWMSLASVGIWFSTFWPRAGPAYLTWAHVFAVLAVALASSGTSTGAFIGWVVAAWTFVAIVGALRILHTERRSDWPTDVPRCRGVPVSPRTVERIVPALRSAIRAKGNTGMLMGGAAPTASLLVDSRNPTPFDYPAASTFGAHGQDEVIEAAEGGRIPWICVIRPPLGSNRPERLESYVEDRTTELTDLPPAARSSCFAMRVPTSC